MTNTKCYLTFVLLLLLCVKLCICVNEDNSCEYDFCDSEERVKRAFVPYRTGKKVASEVSNALDNLLLYSGYDKRIRPQVKKWVSQFCVKKQKNST